MASSALFRYFHNRDALLTALIIDSYSSLAEAAHPGLRGSIGDHRTCLTGTVAAPSHDAAPD